MSNRKVSLNEFVGAPPEKSTPPRRVSLRFIGKIEVLAPLPIEVSKPRSHGKLLANRNPVAGFMFSARSLVFSGGLAMMAIIMLSAILVAIYDQPAENYVSQGDVTGGPIDVAIDPFGKQSAAEGLFTLDLSTPQIPLVKLLTARPKIKSRSARRSIQLAANRPRHQPRLVVSDFVPTNLIIYPENGVIKTRIEPQLVAIHKIPIAVPN